VYIGYGTTLHLTSQGNGITDVPLSSMLMVNGTLTEGRTNANGLAQLTGVEGALTLENSQTTADTPVFGQYGAEVSLAHALPAVDDERGRHHIRGQHEGPAFFGFADLDLHFTPPTGSGGSSA
jgi:hypothetical protein